MEPAKIQQAIIDTKNYFMKHNGYYRGTISLIVGLPDETEDTLNENKKWFDEHWETQHMGYTPLFISTSNNNVTQSELSTTYEKQGYSLVSLEEIALDESHPDLVSIFQSNIVPAEMKHYTSMFLRLLGPNMLFHHWKSNTGMTEKDALLWIAKNIWGTEDYLKYGVDHWRMDEWYLAGKTDQDMLGSYRDLGGIRPPVKVKVDFIEDYKTKKLNYIPD
jgi:hypothetical protein